MLTRLLDGETAAQGLRAVEFQAYAITKEEVAKVGSSVADASREHRIALERLCGKGTILEAVDYFLTHAARHLGKEDPGDHRRTIGGPKTDKRSDAYLKDPGMRLGKFAKSFFGAIGEVMTKEIGGLAAHVRFEFKEPEQLRQRRHYALQFRQTLRIFAGGARRGCLGLEPVQGRRRGSGDPHGIRNSTTA